MIFSVVIPVEAGGGGGVRVLRKVTKIMIEGFWGEFQIFHCRIFGGKKIWKVPFWGGGEGSDAVRFKYVFKGWGGMVQNNLKIGFAWHLSRIPLEKVQPRLFCSCFIYMQIFQLSVTFIASFLLITNLSYVRILLLLS